MLTTGCLRSWNGLLIMEDCVAYATVIFYASRPTLTAGCGSAVQCFHSFHGHLQAIRETKAFSTSSLLHSMAVTSHLRRLTAVLHPLLRSMAVMPHLLLSTAETRHLLLSTAETHLHPHLTAVTHPHHRPTVAKLPLHLLTVVSPSLCKLVQFGAG